MNNPREVKNPLRETITNEGEVNREQSTIVIKARLMASEQIFQGFRSSSKSFAVAVLVTDMIYSNSGF